MAFKEPPHNIMSTKQLAVQEVEDQSPVITRESAVPASVSLISSKIQPACLTFQGDSLCDMPDHLKETR